VADVRALVAARLRKLPASAASSDNKKNTSCPQGRGPANFEPIAELALPVLDGMGGRVSPSGPVAPNMSANSWGVPMPNVTVEVSPGKVLTVDEVVYGYDLVFEAMHLFSYVSWGRVPMQQDPSDALVIADLLGRLQPDCFVELGTNTGGGAVFYAEVMKAYVPRPLVVTIDVHPPTVNWDRFATKACPHCLPVTCHPAWQENGLIEFVQGFTQEDNVVNEVERLLKSRQCKRTVVMHDSDHRGFAVERDLQIYHRFVDLGSYLIVQDTKLSRMRGGRYQTLEAVHNFLATKAGKGHFIIDRSFEYLLFSHHHSGFLRRIAV
jgi:cephalosporin hydroxylase